MSTTTLQGWAVSFGGVSVPFNSHAEAKKFIKQSQKRAEDRRGVFKAVIVRIAVNKEAVQ